MIKGQSMYEDYSPSMFFNKDSIQSITWMFAFPTNKYLEPCVSYFPFPTVHPILPTNLIMNQLFVFVSDTPRYCHMAVLYPATTSHERHIECIHSYR